MRYYTNPHKFYCGIDLHARSMDVCIVHQDGAILVHCTMPAAPAPFLKAVAPSRDALVVAVACLFTGYWLADLCTQEGIAFVLWRHAAPGVWLSRAEAGNPGRAPAPHPPEAPTGRPLGPCATFQQPG